MVKSQLTHSHWKNSNHTFHIPKHSIQGCEMLKGIKGTADVLCLCSTGIKEIRGKNPENVGFFFGLYDSIGKFAVLNHVFHHHSYLP